MPGRVEQLRYPERHIQLPAILHLREARGYREVFDDVGAVGARFDSAGLIAERLYLIEVKATISAAIVAHAPDRASSIESKLAAVLGDLYGRANDALSRAANSVWDRRSRPVVVILAAKFTEDGLVELGELLSRRSTEWMFDFAVWQWRNGSLDTLVEGTAPETAPPDWGALAIPALMGRAPRAKARTLAELGQEAEKRGVRHLLDQFVAEAEKRGWRLNTGRWTVRALINGAKSEIICACYVESSGTEDGLCVGIDMDRYADLPELPGLSGPPSGFLNTNRLIRSDREMTQLFDILAAGEAARS